MRLLRQLLLKHSIEIKTTPDKIWEFFKNLDKNYKIWHPEDHIVFKWIKGNPLQENSIWYAEQYVMGKVTKYNGSCIGIVPNKKIILKFGLPISLVSPKIEWLIEPKGSSSVFTAITYMRFGKLYQKLFKKGMKTLIEVHNKHVKQESENLKKILEKE